MKSRIANLHFIFWVTLAVLGIWITGCRSAGEATPELTAMQKIATATPTATSTPTTTPNPTPTATQPLPTLTQITKRIYISPLEDVPVVVLPGMVTNPFSPPRSGSDDPHQGVDFSVVDSGTGIALSGNPVNAVLGGTVAGIVEDRFPYGNAILVESRLDGLSPLLLDSIPLPTPAPIHISHPILTCPDLDLSDYAGIPEQGVDSERSLYLLYAHLQDPPDFHLGDPITSLQVLGAIGDSGNALNPHLHVELRVGPSDFQFPGMAHYDASASQEEMGYYCLWRVSGAFQVIDPMVLFMIE
jgi:murein DD-endopeptidase MepM/ murein hydrolase activator NlpD